MSWYAASAPSVPLHWLPVAIAAAAPPSSLACMLPAVALTYRSTRQVKRECSSAKRPLLTAGTAAAAGGGGGTTSAAAGGGSNDAAAEGEAVAA